MSRTHAGMAPGEYENVQNVDFSALSARMEKEVFVQQAIKEAGLNIPVDVVIAFEEFIRLPDIDAEIDQEANRPYPNNSGSASAYHDAKMKVAMEKFNAQNVRINDLMVVHKKLFELERSQGFKERVQNIISDDLMASAGMVVVEKVEAAEPVVAEPEDELLVSGEEVIPEVVADVLGQLESEHGGELEPEDMDAYRQADSMGRLAFWQDRIFPSDHLYAQLKSVRAEAKRAI